MFKVCEQVRPPILNEKLDIQALSQERKELICSAAVERLRGLPLRPMVTIAGLSMLRKI